MTKRWWMMSMRTFYKLLRRTEYGELVSCAVENPELIVQYRPGEWAEARVGGLLVFTDYQPADLLAGALYVATRATFEVWTCEVSERVRLPEFSLTRTDIKDVVELLWSSEDARAIKHKIWPARLEFWPEATQAYRRVRLLERVGT
jgi:hypothetical protein